MADKVQIINRALILVGQSPISSASEESKRATTMNELWDIIVEELMQSEPWLFSYKQVRVARLDENGILNYEYAYDKPADCIRVIEPVSDNRYIKLKVIGNKIYSNSDELTLKYVSTRYITDTSVWSVGFSKCMSYLLAINACYRLNGSLSREDRLSDTYYRVILPETRAYDGMQEQPEQWESEAVEIGNEE